MKTENASYPKVSSLYRKKLRLNQSEVIEQAKLEIDLNTLSNYENGYSDAPASVLLKLAKFYDCSLDALLSRSFLEPVSHKSHFCRVDYVIQNGIGKVLDGPDQGHYAFDIGIDLDSHSYQHFLLLQDDPNINLLKGTRLIVRMAENIIEIDRFNEQIYLVRDKMENDSGDRVMTTFFTKAGMIKDDYDEPHKNNLIYYTYHGQIKHSSLRHFKSIIDGIVVKVFMDSLVK